MGGLQLFVIEDGQGPKGGSETQKGNEEKYGEGQVHTIYYKCVER